MQSYVVNCIGHYRFALFYTVQCCTTINNSKMNVITIQSEAFEQLKSMLDAINNRLTAKEKESKEIWLDNQEMMQMLKISKRTAQHYRDSGMISFSQVGNKIYYKLSDVEELLKRHYNKAFKR